jgi:hydroxyacylglutathione hydrolase
MITKAKRLWLWIGIPAGIILVILLAAGLLMLSNISGMASIGSREVMSNVYAVRGAGYVNFYVVKGDSGLVAFDCGEDTGTAAKEMAKLSLDPLKVNAVFLTHTDSDHAGALGLFSNARVYISEQEEQMVSGKTSRFPITYNSIPAGYSLLRDGQDIEAAGVKIHCMLTPGHTPGAMCYLVSGKYLFTGDTLSLRNGRTGTFNDLFNMDTNLQKTSLTKLAGLSGVEYIFTAHYGYSDNFQKAFEPWKGK